MNLYKTKNKPQINADERRFNVLDSRLPVAVRCHKTGMKLAKGRGQIVTPLMIETSGSIETTEISEYTEKYSPSVIWYEIKLATNPTNSNELTSPEFVLVRTSSLLFSCSFMSRRFIADSVPSAVDYSLFEPEKTQER